MNNNRTRTRTISIITAVILGLATLLYLGGLVCQLLTEYQVSLPMAALLLRNYDDFEDVEELIEFIQTGTR